MYEALAKDLRQRQAAGLRRRLQAVQITPASGPYVHIQGRKCLNLASNDYLGLSQHPRLIQAIQQAAAAYGAGSPSSRLLGGTLELHQQVERQFAQFKHAQAALIFPAGYMANQAVLCSLAGPGDLICLDKLVHASLIDAARLSGATVRTFPHGNVERLERLLSRRQAEGKPARHCLVVTDSVFSMDGDVADLPALCQLARRYDAITVVDEAHGTGVLGQQGAGLCELQQVADQVDVVVSTASKALGCLGGIVTADQVIIDTLVNRARQFIYTTAVPPMQVAAIGAAIEVIQAEPTPRQRLAALSHRLRAGLCERGFDVQTAVPTPIVPIVVKDAKAALALADRLLKAGWYAPAVRPPTVPPNSSRVRLSLRADMTDAHVDELLSLIEPLVA